MNDEIKLYSTLLNLQMQKAKAFKVFEKFYSEWNDLDYEEQEVTKIDLDLVINNKKKGQIFVREKVLEYLQKIREQGLDMVSEKMLLDELVNVEQPLCSPFELEETIKELELKGEIYQPRREYWKPTKRGK
jgi:DNA replicative helicase MCM subunit Mcm2 (Cdc46/Mcm family)